MADKSAALQQVLDFQSHPLSSVPPTLRGGPSNVRSTSGGTNGRLQAARDPRTFKDGVGTSLDLMSHLQRSGPSVVKTRTGSVLSRGFILKTDHYPSGSCYGHILSDVA